MKFQSTTHTLKSGHTIKLRIAESDEAQDLIDLKRGYILNSTTIPFSEEEYSDDLDKERRLINKYNEKSNSLLLVAEFENELIGNIDISGSTRSKMTHTAMLGMGIKEKWRNKGLGRILMESAISWSKTHSELKLIWLDVYASNELGYNLYKNIGFKVSGVIEGFFKEKDGYKDKVQMYMNLK